MSLEPVFLTRFNSASPCGNSKHKPNSKPEKLVLSECMARLGSVPAQLISNSLIINIDYKIIS